MALAIVPDVAQLLPVLVWSLSQAHPMRVVYAFVMAMPGDELAIPPVVEMLSHHLHCLAHSAVVAAAVGLIAWRLRGSLWIPLVGWWLHIALDIPTHSQDYYAVPILYPFTYWGVDGVPWTTPWLFALNWAALAVTYWALIRSKRRAAPAEGG